MSTLFVDDINEKTSGNGVLIPGHPVQIISTTKTDDFSTSSSSLVDITGLSLSITPKQTSSKVLIQLSLNWGGVNNIYAGIRLYRDSTFISNNSSASGAQTYASLGVGGDNNNFQYKLEGTSLQFLDSPTTTSQVTYKFQVQTTGGPGTNLFYVNRPHSSDNAAYIVKGTSTMTVTEIAQ